MSSKFSKAKIFDIEKYVEMGFQRMARTLVLTSVETTEVASKLKAWYNRHVAKIKQATLIETRDRTRQRVMEALNRCVDVLHWKLFQIEFVLCWQRKCGWRKIK